MSQQNGAHIYHGPWINWSHGVISGSTITLSNRDGGLLTAFLAIFVSASGAAVWRILSYAIHQLRTNPELQDGLHHQQNLILRNTSTPGGASWEFLQLIFYWWKAARRSFLRSFPLVLLALCNLLLFAVAGVFSSEVTKAAGNESLIRSPNCGVWEMRDSNSPLSLFAFETKQLNDSITAANYARACYNEDQNLLQCNQYVTTQIKWSTNQNASCPFQSGMCVLGDTAAYEMDTGPIDSHSILGVNAPEDDRVTYRKVTTCSVIHEKGYVVEWNNTNSAEGTFGNTFQRYMYGPVTSAGGGTDQNYTWSYNEHSIYDVNGYTLESISALGGYAGNIWTPIPELARNDADLALFILAANGLYYFSPVEDPWFSANLPVEIPFNATTNQTYYQADQFSRAMACIDQHQFCNPSNNKCTPLLGYNNATAAAKHLGLNQVQQLTAGRIGVSLLAANIFYSVSGRGQSALRAVESVFEQTQGPLPNNQWMIELQGWFGVGMAKLQQLIVEYAAGPATIPDGSYISHPDDPIGIAMCYSQKVRSSSATINFSVVGVAIILVVGSILIFANLTLDVIIGFIQRKWGIWGGDYRRLAWVLDQKNQLQRMAYEEAGMGVWRGGANSVPVTRRGDTFGIPSDVDREHPRLTTHHARPSDSDIGAGAGEVDGLMGKQESAVNVDTVEQY